MILPFLVFRPVGSKLLVHPQEAFDVAFLVCRIWNHCLVDGVSEFAVAVLAVSYHASEFCFTPLRIVFVFSSMLSEGFFSFWFAEARTPANGKHTLRVYGQVQLVTQSECSAGSSNP